MADAKKCDRCGKFYVENEQEFVGCTLRHQVHCMESKYFDLCDECVGKLWTFLNYPVEIDDAIARYDQAKEDDKCPDDTSTLDTTKMSGESSSSL